MKKNIITKSTLLNVDSSFRDINPKNIYQTNSMILPNNPLIFTKDSNQIKIYYPNHNFSIGDNIIIQNVVGETKILSNSFYLFAQFNYLVIDYDYNVIDIPTSSNLYCNIHIYGSTTITNMISNIPLNSFIGYKQIFIASDINIIPDNVKQKFTNLNNLLFIKLPANYNINTAEFTNLQQTFTISFTSIAGIDIGHINSNYPINNYNFQSCQTITQINSNEPDYFYININSLYKAFITTDGGGNRIQIMKILNTMDGYPNSNNYTIHLKKSFNNVINIELLSSEFPYVDLLVQKNINNKLYWRNLQDGSHIYSIAIEEGSYKLQSLIKAIVTSMNNVPRISSNYIPLYNIFSINYLQDIQKLTFESFNNISLPNSLSVSKILINSIYYYSLKIKNVNSTLKINDMITITTSDNVSIFGEDYYIAGNYINKEFTIYSIDTISESYEVLLGSTDQIQIIENTTNDIYYGGPNVNIKEITEFSLMFNYPDTLGNILGFKNTGQDYAIYDFAPQISNFDSYNNTNNLDSVGNINTSNNLMNFSGNYNYMLMYLNDIEYIYSVNLPSAFAKILLNGNQGDFLFNTFIPYPHDTYSQSFPIATLGELTVKFMYPDGSIPDFRNINHSFTLRIVEEIIKNPDTRLNSNHISLF